MCVYLDMSLEAHQLLRGNNYKYHLEFCSTSQMSSGSKNKIPTKVGEAAPHQQLSDSIWSHSISSEMLCQKYQQNWGKKL